MLSLSLKRITLFGELKIPGLSFCQFIPTEKNPLHITLDSIRFKLFVTDRSLSSLFLKSTDDEQISKMMNIAVQFLYAQFNLNCNDNDLDLLRKNKWPTLETIEKYINAMIKIKEGLWSFARFELGQPLSYLDRNTVPPIELWKKISTGLYHLSPPESRTILKAYIPDINTIFPVVI